MSVEDAFLRPRFPIRLTDGEVGGEDVKKVWLVTAPFDYLGRGRHTRTASACCISFLDSASNNTSASGTRGSRRRGLMMTVLVRSERRAFN